MCCGKSTSRNVGRRGQLRNNSVRHFYATKTIKPAPITQEVSPPIPDLMPEMPQNNVEDNSMPAEELEKVRNL